LEGLYLAGGSAHPGGGVPMCLQSGRLAAEALLEDH
jgi:1-hydroxycarotenoid 3,4-desaturase